VPFGGNKTVRNAHMIFEYVRMLTTMIQQSPPEDRLRIAEFLSVGDEFANQLHDYGNRESMINPEWSEAAKWTQAAQNIVKDLTAGS
jgi:hypothetical protein